MIFNSFFFILIFLPLTVTGWFVLNRKNKNLADWFLIDMSLWFYGCFSPWYLVILAVSAGMNYGFGYRLEGRKGRLFAGVFLNLLLLGWFKYVTPELSMVPAENTILRSLISIGLPVGLSFYTFSQISYLIDRYRGEIRQDGIRQYLLCLTYFPKIVEGPITRYGEMAEQFQDSERRSVSWEKLTRGILLFIFGLAKKLLIADVLAGAAVFGIQSAYYLDTLSVLLAMTCYALQLYFDFSGFCDMAMGISWMLNIDLPLNFDAPFQAESFPEFWKRWHMTLTRFFTRYVYIPLGGSRKGSVRTFLNVMAVFVLSALWHGIGWNYLLWGLLSGLLVAVGNLFAKRNGRKRLFKDTSSGGASQKEKDDAKKREDTRKKELQENTLSAGTGKALFGKSTFWHGKIAREGKRLGTSALFLLTLVFFGAGDIRQSLAILRNLFRPLWPGWLYRMAGQLEVPEFWLVNKLAGVAAPGLKNPLLLAELLLILGIAILLLHAGRTAKKLAESMRLSRRNAVLAGILLIWCLCSMSGVSTYLYFKF